jgi:protein TonB
MVVFLISKQAGANADFNKEAEKVIKNIKGKWNPAKLGGQNVRSYFKFPISMQFE